MNAVLLEPHPDDAVLFSCWNLLRYRPHVVTVLRSDRMASRAYPGGPVAHSTRALESVAAMNRLGVQHEQWEFSDETPADDEITDRIVALECDLLIAPAVEEGGHPDHNMVGSLAQIHGAPAISYLTYTRGGGRSTHGTEVEFEPSWPVLKLRALACYESQIAHPATAAHFLGGLREYVA
jgi:LmbE family N-acetylglucosaminyl deacetylase